MKGNDVKTCPTCGAELDDGNVQAFASGWRVKAKWNTPDWQFSLWSRSREPIVKGLNEHLRALRCVHCAVVLLQVDDEPLS